MKIRQFIRDSAFRVARYDLALFLQEHEDRLLTIFREEMARLDDEMPEENLFIDIKMVPLGEAILKSALHTITRFLTEEYDPAIPKKKIPVKTGASVPISRVDDQ